LILCYLSSGTLTTHLAEEGKFCVIFLAEISYKALFNSDQSGTNLRDSLIFLIIVSALDEKMVNGLGAFSFTLGGRKDRVTYQELANK